MGYFSSPYQQALRTAAHQRNRAGLARARQDWRKYIGKEGILDWAVEHLSSWAVKELLDLGERVTKVVVMTALNTLDEALVAQKEDRPGLRGLDCARIMSRVAETTERSEIWALLLPEVTRSPELRDVAIECFLRRHIPGGNTPSRLSWDRLGMRWVFQDDLLETLREAPLPMGGLELVVGIGEDEPESCLLAPIQIAWEQGRPDICLSLLKQGLSIRTTYPESMWPTWTLEEAVLAPDRWVMSLYGSAHDRAIESLGAYGKAGSTVAMESLKRAVREQVLELSLPAASHAPRVSRF